MVASRAFDELGPAAANPFDPRTDTEHAYFEALGDLAREQVLVSANIDIVAGTSAGGINGVCLAKVLARNGSQDALKRLWINEGDLTKLLNAPPIGGWRARAVLAVGRTLMRLRQPVSPLRGARMSQLLYDAISAMDQPVDPDRPSLLLPATPLDLFVTTTDLDGAAVLVPSGVGGASQRETNHAQVVQFRAARRRGGGVRARQRGCAGLRGASHLVVPGGVPSGEPRQLRRRDRPSRPRRRRGGADVPPPVRRHGGRGAPVVRRRRGARQRAVRPRRRGDRREARAHRGGAAAGLHPARPGHRLDAAAGAAGRRHRRARATSRRCCAASSG